MVAYTLQRSISIFPQVMSNPSVHLFSIFWIIDSSTIFKEQVIIFIMSSQNLVPGKWNFQKIQERSPLAKDNAFGPWSSKVFQLTQKKRNLWGWHPILIDINLETTSGRSSDKILPVHGFSAKAAAMLHFIKKICKRTSLFSKRPLNFHLYWFSFISQLSWWLCWQFH